MVWPIDQKFHDRDLAQALVGKTLFLGSGRSEAVCVGYRFVEDMGYKLVCNRLDGTAYPDPVFLDDFLVDDTARIHGGGQQRHNDRVYFLGGFANDPQQGFLTAPVSTGNRLDFLGNPTLVSTSLTLSQPTNGRGVSRGDFLYIFGNKSFSLNAMPSGQNPVIPFNVTRFGREEAAGLVVLNEQLGNYRRNVGAVRTDPWTIAFVGGLDDTGSPQFSEQALATNLLAMVGDSIVTKGNTSVRMTNVASANTGTGQPIFSGSLPAGGSAGLNTSLYRLDPVAWTLSANSLSLLRPKDNMAGAFDGSNVYFFGGRTTGGTSDYTAEMEKLDSSGTARVSTSMALAEPMAYLSAVVRGNTILVAGGTRVDSGAGTASKRISTIKNDTYTLSNMELGSPAAEMTGGTISSSVSTW